MTDIKVTDLGGATLRFVDVDGYVIPKFRKPASELKIIFDNIPDITLRNDDVMLCSFPKTGTNWLFEITMMILNKSAKRVPICKDAMMLEPRYENELENLLSPRVVNTHLHHRFLPKDMRTKQTKTILVVRNPKDSAVSFYNFMKVIKHYEYNGQWKNWLPLWMDGKLEYGSYASYLKEWEQVISEGPGFPLHVIYYEDLKLNGKHEVERLAEFLGVMLDEQTILDIVDMCGFDKMSEEKRIQKEKRNSPFDKNVNIFFRKGQIGDWKNWFTVQQDETFNKFWNNEMGSTRFKFKYIGAQ